MLTFPNVSELRSRILMLIRKILMVRIPEISIRIFVISLILDGTVGIPSSRQKTVWIAKHFFIPHFLHFPHWLSVWEVEEVWVVFLFNYIYAREAILVTACCRH